MQRWVEFFQVRGEFAMRNLTVFITIIVASLVVLYLGIRVNKDSETRLSDEIFISYLLAGGGVYSFGKWQDDKTKRSEIDATTTQPTPSVTINQPDKVNLSQ